jgi:molybdate transport system substrate-binding protein
MNRKKIIASIVLAIFSLGMAIAINQAQIAPPNSVANKQVTQQLTISAAASLKDSLTEITQLYNQANANITIRNNFASSGALQQQIENGAPVDVFFAAAAKQMNELEKKNLILLDTRRNLLSNRLVLIVPTNTGVPTNAEDVTSLDSLTKLDDIKRIAIGDPRSVPVGQYTEQALKKSAVWEQVQSKLVLGNNVRQVLQFVESGNAQAGVVYATDAKTSNKVKIVQIINADLHEPILYPIAVLQKSENQAIAKAYVQFLTGTTAKLIFEKYGFSTL